LTRAENGAKGSGRSIEEYSMYEELCKCSELLTRFGGHPMAAGFSLREEDIDAFREKINACCELTEEDFIPKIKVDIDMPVTYPDLALIREFQLLEPFGKSNPKPLFADRNLAIVSARIVGANRNVLQLTLRAVQGQTIRAVSFGDPEQFRDYYAAKFGENEINAAFSGRDNAIRMSIIYEPQINAYQGNESVQIVIRSYK
jgi:single-stranded-DNA-specific exonuclease